jgi:hypothetical protein
MFHRLFAFVFFGCCIVASVLMLTSVTAMAQNEPRLKDGAWHYKSIRCVDTTVLGVTPRLGQPGQKVFKAEDFENSGVSVVFRTHLGVDPLYPKNFAGVVHYQNTDGNDVMMSERAGDRVQVCFLSVPPPTEFCDPDRDPRGRVYRVYDYRQRASYSGWNSEHTCGGA